MPQPEEEKKDNDVKVLKEVENKEEYIAELNKYAESFTENTFKVGDIVVWKEGMRNKNIPEKNIPGVILNLIYPPIPDREQGPSSTYYNDRLDIMVGFISKDENFVVFAHDSRRFTLYEQ